MCHERPLTHWTTFCHLRLWGRLKLSTKSSRSGVWCPSTMSGVITAKSFTCHQNEIPTDFSTLCIVIRLKFPLIFNTLNCALCIFIRLKNSHWFVNTFFCHQNETFLNTSFRACTVRCQWRRPVLSHLQCTMCWPRFSKMTDVSSSHLPVVPKDDRCLGSVGSSSLLSPFPARAWSSSALHVFGFLCYCRVSEFYIGWSGIFRCTYNFYLFKVLKEI